MRNIYRWIYILLLGIFIFIGVFIIILKEGFSRPSYTLNNPPEYTTNEGEFNRSITDTITVTYTSETSDGFLASLDFELKEGKVDWEIVNPENITVYKGYVIYEDGKVFKGLTYTFHSLFGEHFYPDDKEEDMNETGPNGNIIPDFNLLQFDKGSLSGEYKLILKPTKAEGSYKIGWYNRLSRK